MSLGCNTVPLIDWTDRSFGGHGSKDSDSDFRQLILHSVAYYETVSGPDVVTSEEEKYNKNLEETLLRLSDKELKQLLRERLALVVKEKQQGKQLIWDKDFVEKVVKVHLPDLYPVIAGQVAKDSQSRPLSSTQAELVQISYTPGSTTKTFAIYGKHWTGYKLYGFFCRIYWAWNDTQITNVLPSTYGEIYDPTWEYKGLKANQQYYVSPQQFHKYVEGWFQYYYGIQNKYPWLDIDVYAGGSSDCSSGISG